MEIKRVNSNEAALEFMIEVIKEWVVVVVKTFNLWYYSWEVQILFNIPFLLNWVTNLISFASLWFECFTIDYQPIFKRNH